MSCFFRVISDPTENKILIEMNGGMSHNLCGFIEDSKAESTTADGAAILALAKMLRKKGAIRRKFQGCNFADPEFKPENPDYSRD